MTKSLNAIMLLHSVYLEHIPPTILIETLRETMSVSRDKLTRAQVQDMWEDKVTLVPESSCSNTSHQNQMRSPGTRCWMTKVLLHCLLTWCFVGDVSFGLDVSLKIPALTNGW